MCYIYIKYYTYMRKDNQQHFQVFNVCTYIHTYILYVHNIRILLERLLVICICIKYSIPLNCVY